MLILFAKNLVLQSERGDLLRDPFRENPFMRRDAMVKGCAQAKGLCSILRDLGFDAEARISSDASAVLGMAHRQGLGRTRHIDVQYLWIQNEVANGTVHTRKVETSSNPADLFTKCLPCHIIESHLASLHMYTRSSRSDSSLKLHA